MKSIVFLSGLLAVTSAATCDYAVVGPNLQSLGKPIASCMTATGNSYNLARASAPPTSEQAAAICEKCSDFVAAVTALPPWPDCTMNVGGSEQTLTSYFDKMIGNCKTGSSAAVTKETTTNSTSATGDKAVTKATTTNSSSTAGDKAVEAPTNKTALTTGDASTVTSSTPVPSPTSAACSVQLGLVTGSAMATTMVLLF